MDLVYNFVVDTFVAEIVEAFVVALVVITSNCIKAIIAIKAAYLIAMDLPEPCFPF